MAAPKGRGVAPFAKLARVEGGATGLTRLDQGLIGSRKRGLPEVRSRTSVPG